MNQYRGDSELLSGACSAQDTADRTDSQPALTHNRVGNSPSGTVTAAIASPGPFPVRTLIVCFTIWLIATQAMIFDQARFETRVHLLEQAAQPLGEPQVVVPNERSSNLTNGAVHRL